MRRGPSISGANGLPGLGRVPGVAKGKAAAGVQGRRALRRKGLLGTGDQLKILQRGIDLQRAGQLKAAEYQYQLILREDPNHPDALSLMGVLASEAMHNDVAIDYLERALALRPRDVAILNNLANAYIQMEAFKKAVPLLQRALKIEPKLSQSIANLARAYRRLGRAEEAIEMFGQVLAAEPHNYKARVGLGQAQVDAGKMGDAVDTLRGAIADTARPVHALAAIATARRFDGSEPEIGQIEALLADAALSAAEREALHHAAGKIYNDFKNYDDAFRHFHAGKEISGASFRLERFRADIDELMALFTPEFFAERKGFGRDSDRPVFIVGMPRSGTTLTEQILSSHPAIHGAGELSDIYFLSRKAMAPLRAEKAQGRRVFKRRDCVALADAYLAELSQQSDEAVRVTDKMPHNFKELGLIALMLPNARVIHCRRDPMDNCVSCFTNQFNQRHGYNADLETLGLYYREYLRLMDHWAKALPLRLLEVQYEQTVADPETAARRLVDFVGLAWDDACLRFHESKRAVTTPSRWQVRQPIYRTSMQRWRNYEAHLGPLRNALGDLCAPPF